MSKNHRGFSLLEMVISIAILSVVIVSCLKIFEPALKQGPLAREQTKLQNLLLAKSESIKSLGFWVWSGDTASSNNTLHPIKDWQTQLQALGYTGRAQMSTTFYKESSGNLTPFSGTDFDGNTPRDKVKVVLTLYTSQNQAVTASVYAVMEPTVPKLQAALAILEKAIRMYGADHSNTYPATDLSALVPTYLLEIPNDPFTTETVKLTHTEEITDWYYVNSSNVVTLAANSHRVSYNITIP